MQHSTSFPLSILCHHLLSLGVLEELANVDLEGLLRIVLKRTEAVRGDAFRGEPRGNARLGVAIAFVL